MPRIPDIPGSRLTPRSEQESWLKDHVARLCQIDHRRFPGSQPVSFLKTDLAKLETQDFWVCEKSDGIRVLLFVNTNVETRAQNVYLIDRKNEYYYLEGLYFPHHKNPQLPLQDTIVDGELVYDVDPQTNHETMRFLAFDCLVVDGENMMSRPLDKRYGRLQEYFYSPFAKMKKDHPQVTSSHPFDIRVKRIQLSYAAELVFAEMVNLQHGSDGLIYTCVNAPYTPATDENILKWKPPSENSIDFKLVLRFPPLKDNPSQPDFHAKPVFLLHVWCGDTRYEQYDQLYMDDNEWEQRKSSGEQYDDRIVEVHWDTAHNHWRMMRFRDDKLNGNHKSIVEKIIISIADGVEKDVLLERSNSIRTAWKARAAGHAQAPAPMRGAPNTIAVPVQAVAPPLELRYGRLATSQWSKVGGPAVVAGMKR
ncbi:mRNA capping enzyme, catalytic domain-containing protein [Mycena albidolilacea]|uniref:mRNA-capping enzyme subunit alpha n=1 Tax=Mycena albidolilacea TaxID=1033008 RepID=A0AAD7EPK2_9AGAR|nr:mRNA capping enzyme, catalytic domain-containing protein [Mycena albidolilacea]